MVVKFKFDLKDLKDENGNCGQASWAPPRAVKSNNYSKVWEFCRSLPEPNWCDLIGSFSFVNEASTTRLVTTCPRAILKRYCSICGILLLFSLNVLTPSSKRLLFHIIISLS